MKDSIDDQYDALLEDEDLEDLDDEPFDFTGHVLDMDRWKRYQEIVSSVKRLFQDSKYVKKIRSSDTPYPHDKFATMIIVFSVLAPFVGDEASEFAKILEKADDFIFCGTEKSVTLTIVVNDVWIS